MAGLPVSAIATGALLIGCILTPLFCWYVREDGDAWIVNAVVSTIAFPFWAYLMGAVAFSGIHDGNFAVILVLTFTVVSGLISPLASRPKLAARQEAAQPQGRAAAGRGFRLRAASPAAAIAGGRFLMA